MHTVHPGSTLCTRPPPFLVARGFQLPDLDSRRPSVLFILTIKRYLLSVGRGARLDAFVGAGDDFSNWTESGTGTLVGPNLMLTASHIAPWDVDGCWMRFVPAYQDGSGPFGDSFVRQFRGVKSPDDQHDYIICDLYTHPARESRWLDGFVFVVR